MRILNDGQQTSIAAVGPGRIRRHGNSSGIEAAAQGNYKIQSWGKEEQYPVADLGMLFQQRRHVARCRVEFSVGKTPVFGLTVFQETVSDFLRAFLGVKP